MFTIITALTENTKLVDLALKERQILPGLQDCCEKKYSLAFGFVSLCSIVYEC